jgi:aldose 1-epimerase
MRRVRRARLSVSVGVGAPLAQITTMEAVCDQPTPVSLAQHTYWNLGGHGSGSVLDHSVRIAAREYTPVGDDLIPTGELVPVQGTPFDFLRPRKIREEIEQVPGGGYDHNYVLSAHGGKLPTGMSSGRALPVRLAATVVDGKSRRGMDVLTDAPGMQFYTGNFLDQVPGKSGVQYGKHAGLCLETQGFPNAVNTPTFPNVVLLPGETYSHTMVHRFYCTY